MCGVIRRCKDSSVRGTTLRLLANMVFAASNCYGGGSKSPVLLALVEEVQAIKVGRRTVPAGHGAGVPWLALLLTA